MHPISLPSASPTSLICSRRVLFCFFCALARRSFASSTAALGALPPATYVTCVASSSPFRQSSCAPCRLAAPFCLTTHLARKHSELQSRHAPHAWTRGRVPSGRVRVARPFLATAAAASVWRKSTRVVKKYRDGGAPRQLLRLPLVRRCLGSSVSSLSSIA